MCHQNIVACYDYLKNTVSNQGLSQEVQSLGDMIHKKESPIKMHNFIDQKIKGPLLANLMNTNKIKFVTGDITEQRTDAIVNAANSELKVLGMGGVAGAMGKKGGIRLENSCQQISGGKKLEIGRVFTTDSRASGQKILHAVTMDLGGSVTHQTVRKAVRNVIDEAKKQGCKSISIPLFGAGVGGLSEQQSLNAIQKGLYDKIGDIKDLEIRIVSPQIIPIFNTNIATSSFM